MPVISSVLRDICICRCYTPGHVLRVPAPGGPRCGRTGRAVEHEPWRARPTYGPLGRFRQGRAWLGRGQPWDSRATLWGLCLSPREGRNPATHTSWAPGQDFSKLMLAARSCTACLENCPRVWAFGHLAEGPLPQGPALRGSPPRAISGWGRFRKNFCRQAFHLGGKYGTSSFPWRWSRGPRKDSVPCIP